MAQASASAREHQVNKLVESMPEPFPNYRDHVARAVENIVVSHRPDHNHEGRLHNDTAYGLLGDGLVRYTKRVDGQRVREPERLAVIEFAEPKANHRHGTLPDGSPRPYKGYKGDSNYCLEITRNQKGKWEGNVISTFDAYQIVRKHGVAGLRNPAQSLSGQPLVMRLKKHDCLQLVVDGRKGLYQVAWVRSDGRIALALVNEANVDARDRSKDDAFSYLVKTPSPLQNLQARFVTISPIGDVRSSTYKG